MKAKLTSSSAEKHMQKLGSATTACLILLQTSVFSKLLQNFRD